MGTGTGLYNFLDITSGSLIKIPQTLLNLYAFSITIIVGQDLEKVLKSYSRILETVSANSEPLHEVCTNLFNYLTDVQSSRIRDHKY